MTPIRAQGIITAAKFCSTYGPWSDQLDNVMALDEHAAVRQVWNTLPDNTSFVDARNSIAYPIAWKLKAFRVQR
jgi:hypothetical protein